MKRNQQMTVEELRRLVGVSNKSANRLTDQALQYLRMQGLQAWRQNNTAVYDPKIRQYRKFQGRKGVSDIIGICPMTGLWIAVEVKVGEDKLSADQIDFLEMVSKAGGFAHECRSISGLDDAFRDWRKPGENFFDKNECK